MMEPLAAVGIAVDATRREVLSARPDAPVVLDRARPRPAADAARHLRVVVASVLRHAADAVEPRPVLAPCTESCAPAR